MKSSQHQILADHGKMELNAVVNTKKHLSVNRSTNRSEQLTHSISDVNDQIDRYEDPRKSDHINNGCQQTDIPACHDPILADYKNANLNRRLQMYLQFPFLKSEFDSINRNDPLLKTSSDFELQIKTFAAQMGMALGSAAACRGPFT